MGTSLACGQRVKVITIKRNFRERTDKDHPGRSPGSDLTGNDLIGQIGQVIDFGGGLVKVRFSSGEQLMMFPEEVMII